MFLFFLNFKVFYMVINHSQKYTLQHTLTLRYAMDYTHTLH